MLMPFFIQAQDLVDALRYSQIQIQGTARSGSMGNAFGALGGDFTSVSINPAGIGLYRSGEFPLDSVSGENRIVVYKKRKELYYIIAQNQFSKISNILYLS